MDEEQIKKAAQAFEKAKGEFEALAANPVEGSLDDRVNYRTALAMAEVAYRVASKRLNTMIEEAAANG